MTGRALSICVLAAFLTAPAQAASREVELALANALHAGDAAAAIKLFDPQMPGYARLRDDFRQTVQAAEVGLAFDPETGAWLLVLTSRDLASGVTRRQAKVAAPEVNGLIHSLNPPDFFAPPPGREPWDLLFSFAATLENEDRAPSLEQFDPKMPGFDALKTAIRALWTQWRIEPALELRGNEGDDTHRTLKIDWALALVDRENTSISSRRDEIVTCKVEKQAVTGKKGAAWRIVSFTPASLF